MEALLDSMQSLSPSVTVAVKDSGDWVQSALTDDISAAFGDMGWDIEYKEEEKELDNRLVIKSKKQ